MRLTDQQVRNYIDSQSCLLWAINNQFRNEKNIPLDFKKFRFLKDVFDDFSPVIVARKASQLGFSTLMIFKSLWLAKQRGYNIIYTLPTFGDVSQFVPSKVNSLIQANPLLVNWTHDKDSILQKKIGNAFIYYRGTFSRKTEDKKLEASVGIMYTSDLNIHDECDRSDQDIIEQYESRLEASAYRGRWYFSNPTHPRTYSQKIYEKSDQKHWFVKCEHCGKRQYLDYYENICQDRKIYICKKCKKEISDQTRQNGEWVKKINSDISGYWLSHLICPWHKAADLIEQEKTKSKQYFYNFCLGLPYIGSDIVVNRDLILQNIDYSEPNYLENNVIGVDVGLKKHYVLGNQQGIFKVGETKEWSEIEDLMKKFDVRTAVFDALPDLTEPRKIRDKYPGVVFLSYFKKEVRKADFVSWDYKTRTVYSDRTKIIQQTIDDFLERKIRFQLKPEELNGYIKHWESLYRTEEEDNLGIKRDAWQSSGDDHYAFATIFYKLALLKTGEGEIKIWSKPEKINTNQAPDLQKLANQTEKLWN